MCSHGIARLFAARVKVYLKVTFFVYVCVLGIAQKSARVPVQFERSAFSVRSLNGLKLPCITKKKSSAYTNFKKCTAFAIFIWVVDNVTLTNRCRS